MSTVDSIDERIRLKAANELRARLRQAFTHVHEATYYIGGNKLTAVSTVRDALDAIEKSAFESRIKAEEEKAVSEFLRKVDSLQEQIDGLRDEVQS